MPVCRSCGKNSYDCILKICKSPFHTSKSECLYECALTDPRFIDVLKYILAHCAKMGYVEKVEALLRRLSFRLTDKFLDRIVLYSCRENYYPDLKSLAAIIALFRKAGYTVCDETHETLLSRIDTLIRQAETGLANAKRYLTKAETNPAEAETDLAQAETDLAYSESSLSSLMAEKELIMTA